MSKEYEEAKEECDRENNQCINCDSNSMEECLLIRHCKYWVTKKKKK